MVVLKQVQIDEIDGYQGEYDGVDPTADGVERFVGVFVFFPPIVGYEFGNECIENEW